MSDDQQPEAPATEAEEPESPEQPAETVDWKAKAREWEKRAKSNSDAARRLAELEQSQKTEQERLAERAETAEQQASGLASENARLRVAIAKGLPSDLVDRLRGDTEDELNEDADKLLTLVASGDKPRTPAPDPTQGTRQQGSTSTASQFAAAVDGLL